jgi:hypothetical protein
MGELRVFFTFYPTPKQKLIFNLKNLFFLTPEPVFLDGLSVEKFIPGIEWEPSTESSRPCPIKC